MSWASTFRGARGLPKSKWVLILAICLLASGLAQRFIRIGFNETGSLTHRVFIVIQGRVPVERGEYVVFKWAGQGGFYHRGDLFTKVIEGVPGDRIEVTPERIVMVAGREVGYAKPRASNGKELEVIEPGVIPPGYVFVRGQSVNSLDSRYKLVGLVPTELMVGTAYAIF